MVNVTMPLLRVPERAVPEQPVEKVLA